MFSRAFAAGQGLQGREPVLQDSRRPFFRLAAAGPDLAKEGGPSSPCRRRLSDFPAVKPKALGSRLRGNDGVLDRAPPLAGSLDPANDHRSALRQASACTESTERGLSSPRRRGPGDFLAAKQKALGSRLRGNDGVLDRAPPLAGSLDPRK